MIGTGACAGLICSLWAFGLSHAVYGQVTSENEPAPQSADMRISPMYLPASADLQAQTREIVGPIEWSANEKQLIVKPALLVLHETVKRKFEVRLSSKPSGDVTVAVSVPTRLDGKLLLTTTSLSFTASNYGQFQEVSVKALSGSDTGDKKEVLTLEASGGGYNGAEANVSILVDRDVCVKPTSHWRSVREGTSCAVTYACAKGGLGVGDYIYLFHVNGSATPEVDLIVNGLDSLEVTEIDSDDSGWEYTTDQLVAPADGIPEGDETLGCFCRVSPNLPDPRWKGSQILILDADGWAVGDTAAAESSGEMTFLLKFPKPVERDLTVRYKTEDASAIAGDDYDSRTDSVTVQKGDTSAEIRVPLIPDNIAEGVEEFKLVTWSDQFRGIGSLKATGRILDPAGIQLQPNPLKMEEDSSATYQARLTIKPSDEVTVAISGYAGTDVRLVEPTSLTFMPSDFGWKDVKVSTAIDSDANSDRVTLTHTASGASEYAGKTSDLEVIILDRYAVVLKVTPTVLALKENGSDPDNKEDFEVSLGAPPVGGEVKVAVSVADALQNKVSLSESDPLTFDTSSWDKAQTITVTALADADAADESGTVDLTASGANYDGQKESVTVTVEDDEVPELIVSPEKVNLTEDADPGKEKSFKVRLNAAPAVPEVRVAVTVSTDLSGKATVDRSSLVYTSSNWNVDQTVTVTALADADTADESDTVNLTATGGEFEGKTGSVTVEVKDDDIRGLRVSPTTLALKEDATHPDHGMDIRVRLQSAPVGGSVTVSASASTGLAGKVSFSAALTFTSTDWNVEQSITVTALADAGAADESGTVDLTASGAGYDGQSGSVTVTVEDDEVPELIVSPEMLSLTEDADPGKEKSFKVRLNAAPAVPEVRVAVNVSTDLSGKATVDRSNLVYTSSTWSVDQTVTVTALADADVADESGTVGLTATGGEFEGKIGSVAVVVKDDDVRGLRVSPTTLALKEDATHADHAKDIRVRLQSAPVGGSVTVSASASANLAGKVSFSAALTFTSTDWDVEQSITVTARDDADAADESGTVDLTASGAGYGGQIESVQVTVEDDEVTQLLLSPKKLSLMEDADPGKEKSFEVRLNAAPAVPEVSVAVNLSTDVIGKATVDPGNLVYTSSNWSVDQTVTVTALTDADVADESGTVDLIAAGGEFEGKTGSVAVDVKDDDVRGLRVSPTALALKEDATHADHAKDIRVRLQSAPVGGSVTVSASASASLAGKVSFSAALTFTSTDWNVEQSITVTAMDDADVADESGTVELTASGAGYAGQKESVTVAISDAGTPALKFSDPTLNIDEGGSATYTVWLATEPSATVFVPITSDNVDVTLNRKALSFGVGDWNQPQRITVSAREDNDASLDKAKLAHKASGGGYESVTGTVAVNVIENDTPGLTITPPAITVVEGERGTYRVALVTEPMSAVTVAIGSSNPDVKPAPVSLEFSAVNWGIEQQVAVTAARDSDVNDATATLTHTASGADYGGVTKDLVVTVRDPDVLAGLVVSPRSLTVTEGTEERFSVRLLTQPTQAVTVQVTGDDGTGLRVDPGILRFTTEDWDTAVQIVVEAEQDDDGMDARERLTLTASGAEYTGQEESVVVTIEDDDMARIVVVPQEFTIDEGGDKSYEVSLSTAPSAEVTVEIASDNPNVGLDREVLTFAVNDWDEAQEVTVRAFEDEDAVDDFARLLHTASGGDYEGLTATVSIEVTDNDEVELRVSPQSLRLVEGGSGKVFEVWLGAVPSGEVKVSVTEASTLTAKVSVNPSSLTFSPSTWESPQPVMVTAFDDEDANEETGAVRLEARGGGYNGESAEVQIGVTDTDAPHRVDLSQEVVVTEGAGPARIEVRLNRESNAEVRVHYTTRSGTATAGADYAHTSNTLTFAPGGGLSQWIDVPIVDDRVHEEEESFRLVLGNEEGAELGNTVGTVTILDNDLAPTFRAVPAVYVREDGVAQVHVRLSNASSQPVTASYSTEDVTATGGKDYQSAVAGAIMIGAGDMEAVIEVATHDDAEHEGREAFVVQLGDGRRIVVTILDNDVMPGLSVEDVMISEDGGRAKVSVVLDGASAVRVGVAYATQDGTATAGEDYTRAMGTLVFAPGEVKREVFIPVHRDEVLEEDETFTLRLSVPEHAQLLDGEAIVTIVDDPLEVSIYDGTGAENAEELVLPVRLNYSSSHVVSAQFAVTGGTATPDEDFESTQGMVVFEPGSVEAQVRIPLKDDDLVEGDETVEVTLSDPLNAVLGQATATGTITDDETVPGVQVRALPPTAREAVFVITAAAGQVRYRTMDGTAWEGEDYERTEGMLEFGTGGRVKEVRVQLLTTQGKGEVFALMVEVDGEAIRAEVVLGGGSDRRGRALLGRSMAQHVVEAVSERLQGGVVTCMPRPYPGQGVRASHMLSGCGMQASGERVSVWGRGAYSRLRGSEVQGLEIVTASLGADYRLGSRWLMGLMVSRSEARESSLQMTGWYPYVRYGGQEHQVWGLAGAGQGEGTGMRLMAAGIAGRLARTRGMRLGYEADGFWLGMDREIGVRRLRAGLEGSVVLGEVMEPYVEAALLHSAGDAERGLGMEAGGGMRVRMGMMQAEVMSRRVVVQAEEGAGEWGYAGMLRYGGLEGMGVQVRPSWGRTHVGSLWQSERPWEVYGSDGRMDVELGYGAQMGGRSVLRPHVGVGLRERGRDYRIGAGVQGRRGIGFSMSGMAMEHMAPYQPVHYGVTASGYVRW